MARTNSEKIEQLHEKMNEMEVDKRVHDGINKWIRTVCITATCSTLSFFGWLGNFTYNNSHAVYEGARAFIAALGQSK